MQEGALCAPRAVDADITEGTEGYEEDNLKCGHEV